MHLASTLTGTRLVAAAVAFAAGFGLYRAWPDAPPDPERVSTATTYTYVPLMGDPTRAIEDAQDQQGAGCAPFVAPLIAHPNWSLQIADGASGCTGDWIHHSYEVHADGSVLWTADRMPPRVLQLTAVELAMITRVNAFPCGRTDPVGYTYGWMRVSPGGDDRARGSAVLPNSSLAGQMVDAILVGARARYSAARLAQIGPFELHLTAKVHGRRYRIDLDASGHLVVHRGKDEVITPAERVELFDFVATRIGAVHGKDEDYPVLRGSLVAAGVRLPISLHQWEDQQLSVLWQALADASELESRR